MTDLTLDPTLPAGLPSAQPVAHVDALPVGTRLAEFEVQGLLGVGGFGLVYRAYDHSLHRTVAIKEYMPAALAARQDGLAVSVRSSADQATYASGLQSYVAEARLLAQFDHPSLVKVYRFWEANNTAYMVMPLYSGMTLKQARSQMAAPPPEEWLRTMLWSILQALQVLHEHDTLHRDVSPDNIFLQDMGPPVLLDLGAARRAISDRSHKLTAILKVNYAPIEQYAEAEALKQGPWTDLYSLAAVVYSCLRNDPPLPATARVVSDSMPTVGSVADTVHKHFGHAYSEAFVQTIGRALAVQPAGRPQSVQAFVGDMGLQAPAGLGKFDWRSALGAGLLADAESRSSSFDQTQAQITQAQITQAQITQAQITQAQITQAQITPTVPRSTGRRLGLVALAGGLLLAAGLAYWVWSGEGLLVATPEPAAIPGRAPEPTATPGPDAATPVAGADGASTSAAQAPKPVTRPASAPRAAARAAASAKPLCADRSFVTRPVCILLECQKAENYNRPVCVESRRRPPDPPPQSSP